MESQQQRASRSITLALIGSVGILAGFKSCTRNDESDKDRIASTRPAGDGSGYYDNTNHWHYWNHGGMGSTHGWLSSSSGFGSHFSGTSRGGFGSIGHSHGGGSS